MEEHFSTITYDEDWQSVSEPDIPAISGGAGDEAAEITAEPRPKTAPKHLLLSIQLVVCVLAGIAAFALKNIGGEVYEKASKWYFEQLNDTAVFDGSHGFDLPFNDTATADEA